MGQEDSHAGAILPIDLEWGLSASALISCVANRRIQMLIGVPKEIKNHEYRVGLTPASVRELVLRGHQVMVQKNAGTAIGLFDDEYVAAGASISESAKEIFSRADMIVK